jgi:flagellar biosynthetic protein FliO
MVRTLKYSLLMALMLVTTGGIASAQKENSKPEPAATAELTPPSPQQQPAASPENNDRLPFMAQTELDTKEAAPSVAGLLLRTVGALLLIVGLIVAVAWGMKRFAGARFGSPKEDAPQLALLNSLSLGDRRSLAVIRFGSRTLLIGSTSQNLTLLAEDEIEDFSTATPRSVADFLNDEDQPVEFAEQLALASDQLTERLDIGRGPRI